MNVALASASLFALLDYYTYTYLFRYGVPAYGVVMKVKIGELAKMTGCQVVTIRYYEKEGLLPEPDRTGANYRLYGDEEIERLHFIRHCRHHDMKLSDIRALLAFKDNPKADCRWVNSMIEGHIARVDAQISSLTHLKKHLESLLKKCSGKNEHGCGILKSLNTSEGCPYCEGGHCRQESSPSARSEDVRLGGEPGCTPS